MSDGLDQKYVGNNVPDDDARAAWLATEEGRATTAFLAEFDERERLRRERREQMARDAEERRALMAKKAAADRAWRDALAAAAEDAEIIWNLDHGLPPLAALTEYQRRLVAAGEVETVKAALIENERRLTEAIAASERRRDDEVAMDQVRDLLALGKPGTPSLLDADGQIRQTHAAILAKFEHSERGLELLVAEARAPKPDAASRSKSEPAKRERVDYRARVVEFLTGNDEQPSTREIVTKVKGPRDAVAVALDSLVDDGTVIYRLGKRDAHLHQLAGD